jgi:hypothetical protein
MRVTLKICLFITINVALTASVLATSSLVLHGDITDSEGAVIRGAHVLLQADKAGGLGAANTDLITTSDAMGRFEAGVGSGFFYDVCVMADAFIPQCRKVLLREQAISANIFV